MSESQLPILYSLELGELQRVLSAYADAIQKAGNPSVNTSAAGRSGSKVSTAAMNALAIGVPPVTQSSDPSSGPTTEVTPFTPKPIPDPKTPTKTKLAPQPAVVAPLLRDPVTPQQLIGLIDADQLNARIVLTTYIGSTDYAEDIAGVPTGGWKLDSAEVTYKLKIGAGWFGTAIRIGASTYTLGVTSALALTGIATSGSSATDVIWWRGNDDGSINGGAPVIIDPLWALDRSPAWAVGDRCLSGPPSTVAATYLSGRFVYECTTAGAALTTAQATAAAWSAVTIYAVGNTVTSLDHSYVSKQNGNTNNTPTVGGDAWWTDLGLTYGITGTLRTTDSYISGEAKFKCVGWMYTSVNSANSGCRGWIRSTAYAVGDLVIADVPSGGSYVQGYVADNSKMYGNPTGMVPFVGSVYGGNRVYRCTTAGTSSPAGFGPSGTTTGITDGTAVWEYWAENTGPEDRVQIWGVNSDGEANGGWVTYEIRIQPKTNKDNLDALTHIDIDAIDAANVFVHRNNAGLHHQISVPVPSRKYYSPSTPAHIGNMVRTSLMINTVSGNANTYINAAPYAPQLKFKITLHNVSGQSGQITYTNWAYQNILPVPYSNNQASAPSGGGGGGGGATGGCPEPWVKILTHRGEVAASEIVVGDIVLTRHEESGVYGEWPVISVEPTINETAMLIVRRVDSEGNATIMNMAFAMNHKFKRNGQWVPLNLIQPGATLDSTDGSTVIVLSVEPRGVNDVVKITVADAHTYSTSGVLSHNIKTLGIRHGAS